MRRGRVRLRVTDLSTTHDQEKLIHINNNNISNNSSNTILKSRGCNMVETDNRKAEYIVMWPLDIDYMDYKMGVTIYALCITVAPFTRHGDI